MIPFETIVARFWKSCRIFPTWFLPWIGCKGAAYYFLLSIISMCYYGKKPDFQSLASFLLLGISEPEVTLLKSGVSEQPLIRKEAYEKRVSCSARCKTVSNGGENGGGCQCERARNRIRPDPGCSGSWCLSTRSIKRSFLWMRSLRRRVWAGVISPGSFGRPWGLPRWPMWNGCA